MKVLLDENITEKCIPVLKKYGHDTIHVLNRLHAGESDTNVFKLALQEHRALITLNGKDFIIMIPPQTELKMHYGLIWLKGFQVTKKTYIQVMDTVGLFLKNKGNSIKNEYYAVKQIDGSYKIIQRYPKSTQNPIEIF